MSKRLALVVAVAVVGFAPDAAANLPNAALRHFLRTSVASGDTTFQEAVPSLAKSAVWIDLNGDGRSEALVFLDVRDWCGTGGCDLLVLEQTRAGFRVRGRVSVTHLPIGVLRHRSHGWRDLVVEAVGGGIQPGYRAVLPFDGRAYAGNASVAPAFELPRGVNERIIMAGATKH